MTTPGEEVPTLVPSTRRDARHAPGARGLVLLVLVLAVLGGYLSAVRFLGH